jgi:hypothetical protein
MAVGAGEMLRTFESIVEHLTALSQGQPSSHSNEEVLLATVQSWFETRGEATSV